VELDDMYIIQPAHHWWGMGNWAKAKALPDGFCYTSDTNPWWLAVEELQQLVELT
jgi:UDP-N-acetylglucosamine 4,6-dehydratase/5-epimerase